MTEILHSILLAVGSLLATALVGLVAQYMKKQGLELTTAQHDFLAKVAGEAVSYAEEKALSGNTGGNTKLGNAIDHVVATIPGTSAEDASRAIHAALPESGFGAVPPPPPSCVVVSEHFDPTKSSPK